MEWISRSQCVWRNADHHPGWLALARIDRGALCERNASSDLAKIVTDVVREQELLPSAGSCTSTSPCRPACREWGDAVSISMLVSNLIEMR